MKLVTFTHEGLVAPHVGTLADSGEEVLDLTTAAGEDPALSSMRALIEAGPEALARARALAADAPRRALSSVRLLAPVPRPAQMRDALCFEEHLKNAIARGVEVELAGAEDPEAKRVELIAQGRATIPEVWYRQPIYYKANRFAVTGPDTDVTWPSYAQYLDYELEFGCWIGKQGRDIAPEDAREHIFGYCIFNDFSARDAQFAEMAGRLGPAKGKDFDGANAMGPWLVTADEIEPYELTMVARVNGEEWSRGTSGSMHWRFEQVIAHISQSETLYPGEFIGSGTVGTGCGLELGRRLSPGDEVELEVEGLGVLRNRLVAAS
jgi:2-keto-4-pentenoate hydratase/2-oxohepta-3-ene-1,7-dioic acid hydratase in catechol pathway